MVYTLLRFLGNTQRCTTIGRTTMDEGMVSHRDLYLKQHTTLTTEERAIPTTNRPQNQALDGAANGPGY